MAGNGVLGNGLRRKTAETNQKKKTGVLFIFFLVFIDGGRH
jgi:hypothetical protein